MPRRGVYGANLKPTTAFDPLLRQIFTEQERLRISTHRLAKLAHMGVSKVMDLRHPSIDHGKTCTLAQARRLAEALDFKFPDKLIKNGD